MPVRLQRHPGRQDRRAATAAATARARARSRAPTAAAPPAAAPARRCRRCRPSYCCGNDICAGVGELLELRDRLRRRERDLRQRHRRQLQRQDRLRRHRVQHAAGLPVQGDRHELHGQQPVLLGLLPHQGQEAQHLQLIGRRHVATSKGGRGNPAAFSFGERRTRGTQFLPTFQSGRAGPGGFVAPSRSSQAMLHDSSVATHCSGNPCSCAPSRRMLR